ncbi:MAG: MC/SLC25 family protein [Gammaproteobacteria bacterium]
MQSGSLTNEQEKSQITYLPNFTSRFVGSAAATLFEVGGLHPIDTFAKNAMAEKSHWNQFIDQFQRMSLREKSKRVFQGVLPALGKKGPQRVYTWLAFDYTNLLLTSHCSNFFENQFGSHASIAMSATAGFAAGMTDPIVVHPFDTVQVINQHGKHTVKIRDAYQILGLQGLYRGFAITACRNGVAATSFFGFSTYLNTAWNNEDKENDFLNLSAKFGGGIVSTVLSQPFDVMKFRMQTAQHSLTEMLSNTSVGELCTRGLGMRALFFSTRIAIGYFAYEKCVKLATECLGTPTQPSSPHP